MNRRIAVCDDDPLMLEQLSLYLNEYRKKSGDTFEIFYFSSGEEMLSGLPEGIQLLLLDIQMSGLNGIETARRLRKEHDRLLIIFITSNVQYALEGYEVHAFAFLRKPVQYSAFHRHLTEALAQLDISRRSIITFPLSSGAFTFDCKGLIYVEVLQHICTLVFSNQTQDLSIPLQ